MSGMQNRLDQADLLLMRETADRFKKRFGLIDGSPTYPTSRCPQALLKTPQQMSMLTDQNLYEDLLVANACSHADLPPEHRVPSDQAAYASGELFLAVWDRLTQPPSKPV